MARSSRHHVRTSAAKPPTWPQICAACRAVIAAAADADQIDALRVYVGASADTLTRMLASDAHGGWTGPRIAALRAFEQQLQGTATIATAWAGATSRGDDAQVERDSAVLLGDLLRFASDLQHKALDGLTVAELRELMAELPHLRADLDRFESDAMARIDGGRRG